MKRVMILFFIVNILSFSVVKSNTDNLIIAKNHQEITEEKITELNARIEALEKEIKYRPATAPDNGGYVYNLDQIYNNSLTYYSKALLDIKWFIGIIGALFIAAIGVFKWDNNKKLKEEKDEIDKKVDKFENNNSLKFEDFSDDIDKKLNEFKNNNNLKFKNFSDDIKKFQDEFIKIDDYLKELKQMNEKINYKYQFTLALTQETNEIKKMYLETSVVPLVNTQNDLEKITLFYTLGDLSEISEEKIDYYNKTINLLTNSIDLSKKNETATNYFQRGILFKKIKIVYTKLNNKGQVEIFLTKAINDFDKAIQLDANQDYIFEKAEALIHMGESTKNNEYYTEALNLIDKIEISSRAFYLNGKIRCLLAINTEDNLKKQEILKKALEATNKAINYSSSKNDGILDDTYFLKSYINFNLGYYEEAIEDIDKMNQNLISIREYKQKASCEMKLSRYDEAIINYTKVLNLDPNNLDILNEIATAFYKDKATNTNKAIQYFKKIIKKDCKYWRAYNNLAEIYINQEKFKEAIPFLYECLNLDLKKEFNIDITTDSYKSFSEFLEKEHEKNELASVVLSRLKNLKGFNKKS